MDDPRVPALTEQRERYALDEDDEAEAFISQMEDFASHNWLSGNHGYVHLIYRRRNYRNQTRTQVANSQRLFHGRWYRQ